MADWLHVWQTQNLPSAYLETYQKSEGRITPDEYSGIPWVQKEALSWQSPNNMSMSQFMETIRKRSMENSDGNGNAA